MGSSPGEHDRPGKSVDPNSITFESSQHTLSWRRSEITIGLRITSNGGTLNVYDRTTKKKITDFMVTDWVYLNPQSAVPVTLGQGMRIPGDADQRSELMSITVPK